MTFITSTAKSLVHFYKKEQQINALKNWRNGIFFLILLSAYTSLLPWWSGNEKFKSYAAAEILPITNQLPELSFKGDELHITPDMDIIHPISKELRIHISTQDTPDTKAPFIITPKWMSLRINNQVHKADLIDVSKVEGAKVDPSLYDQILTIAPWMIYGSVFFSMLLTTGLQCLFLAGLFFVLNKKRFKPRFISLLKLSALASVPFAAIYAISLFYQSNAFFSTLLPSVTHFIFFSVVEIIY